jgi:hypothetical protein
MSTAILNQELRKVTARRRHLYRPAQFRTILNVVPEVPPHVEKIEIEVIDSFASIKPIQYKGGQLPTPTVQRQKAVFTAASFGCGFEVIDEELTRARETGTDLSAVKALANARAAEELLETIAAQGDPYGLNLGGFGNNAEVAASPVVAVTKSVGGTAWTTAGVTAEEIAQDVISLVNGVHLASKQIYTADTVVVPLARMIHMVQVTNSFGRSALDMVQKVYPGMRFLPWGKLDALGAGSTPRMIAFAARFPEVARFVLPQELTEHTPVPIAFGHMVPQKMTVIGAIVEQPLGVRYMDAI